MKYLLFALIASIIAAVTIVNADNDVPEPALVVLEELGVDIQSTLIAAGIFSTLVAALDATGFFVPPTNNPGPFFITLFAPTDDAFDALPDGLVLCLLKEENVGALFNILDSHIVYDEVLSTGLTFENFNDSDTLDKLDSLIVTNETSDGGIVLNDSAKVIFADGRTNNGVTNGVIHVIDAVLIPPGFDAVAFLETCGRDVSAITAVEDAVEEPVEKPATTANIVNAVEEEPATIVLLLGEIVDIPSTLVAAGMFNTLNALLGASHLVGPLSGDESGPYTVFAPTDDAFDALPEGFVKCLSKEENKGALSAILIYHVVDGEMLSTDLTALTLLPDNMIQPTLYVTNNTIDDTTSDGNIIVLNDSATVILPDVRSTNGVIHIIDAVLIPPPFRFDVTAFLESCVDDTPATTSSSSLSYALLSLSYALHGSILGLAIIAGVSALF
jgi:transforming growth factor-beta-induced protein